MEKSFVAFLVLAFAAAGALADAKKPKTPWICISATAGITELAHRWAPGERQFDQ